MTLTATTPRARRRVVPFARRRRIPGLYSSPLVRALARIVDDRPALEVAAGDGSLTAVLRGRGVPITAVDVPGPTAADHAGHVVRMDTATALRNHRPEVVLCAWPAPANAFEAAVFETPSVQTYVVVGASHTTGRWDVYAAQRDFDVRAEPRLAAMVHPRVPSATVLVFTRRER